MLGPLPPSLPPSLAQDPRITLLTPRKFFGLSEDGKLFGWTKQNELFVGRAAQLVSTCVLPARPPGQLCVVRAPGCIHPHAAPCVAALVKSCNGAGAHGAHVHAAVCARACMITTRLERSGVA